MITDEFTAGESALRSLSNRYADAVTRADFDTLADCWTVDGRWRVTAPFGFAEDGGAAVAGLLEERRQALEVLVMAVASVVATEVTGESVVGRTVIEEIGKRTSGETVFVLGVYHDEIVKVDGQWRFASRTLDILAYDTSASSFTVPRT